MNYFGFDVCKISFDEYEKTLKNAKFVPFYADASMVNFYHEKEFLMVKKGDEIVAVYAFPLMNRYDRKIVKRNFRITPYTTPVLLAKLNTLQTKELFMAIFKFIFDFYDILSLPLDIDFASVMALQSLGVFVEQRSTHIVKSKLDINSLNSKLRNHIKRAEKEVVLNISTSQDVFNFNEAIKGNEEEVSVRTNFAKKLLNMNCAMIFNAVKDEKTVAGVFVCFDEKRAYLLHSWQNDETPRGSIPFLIFNAINHIFDMGKELFDFEGSVINNIDNFFASFGTQIETYPYLHYAKDRSILHQLIDISIDIDGRQIKS